MQFSPPLPNVQLYLWLASFEDSSISSIILFYSLSRSGYKFKLHQHRAIKMSNLPLKNQYDEIIDLLFCNLLTSSWD